MLQSVEFQRVRQELPTEQQHLFFVFIHILLKYIWLSMFQVHSKLIQLHVYTYIIFQGFFFFFFIIACEKIKGIVPSAAAAAAAAAKLL